MDGRLRVGLLGVGYWGSKWARVLRDHPEVSFVWAVDPKPAVGLPNMIASPRWEEVDAVVVATPPHDHFDSVMSALSSRTHVLVEKPMTLSSATAATVERWAAESGMHVMVGHTFLYTDTVRALLHRVPDLGRLFSVQCKWLGGINRADVDAWWSIAPHPVSVLLKIFGGVPGSVVHSSGRMFEAGRAGAVRVGYLFGDVTASVSVDWSHPGKTRRIVVSGERGVIVCDALERTVACVDGVRTDTRPAGDEPLWREISEFGAWIRGRRSASESDASFGRLVVETLERGWTP